MGRRGWDETDEYKPHIREPKGPTPPEGGGGGEGGNWYSTACLPVTIRDHTVSHDRPHCV